MLVLVLLIPLPIARAHTGSQFWLDTWPAGDIAYDMTTGVPGGLGSNQHDQIAAGGQQWNALTNFITFKRSGDEVSGFNNSDCDPQDIRPNAIHWVNLTNFIAVVFACQTFNRVTMGEFQMAFDSSQSWYYGTSGVPSGSYMVSGVSGHEFGHAAGGWLGNNQQNHFTIDNTNGLCEASVPIGNLHTMCRFADRFKGNNHQGSLEFHDIDTFQVYY
jgi:hypothetical protein